MENHEKLAAWRISYNLLQMCTGISEQIPTATHPEMKSELIDRARALTIGVVAGSVEGGEHLWNKDYSTARDALEELRDSCLRAFELKLIGAADFIMLNEQMSEADHQLNTLQKMKNQ